jgi:hypothetical protein
MAWDVPEGGALHRLRDYAVSSAVSGPGYLLVPRAEGVQGGSLAEATEQNRAAGRSILTASAQEEMRADASAMAQLVDGDAHSLPKEWARTRAAASFRETLEAHQRAGYRHGTEPDTWHLSPSGTKYTRVFSRQGQSLAGSVRYFIRNQDGAIFAAEGWKKPNLRRQFGTLATMDQFDWGGYEAVAKPGSDYVMKPTRGGYQTAVPRRRIRAGHDD